MKKVPVVRGIRWVADGANLLGQALGPLAAIAALWLLVSMVQFIPLVGPVALILFMPTLTAGLLTAFHLVASGKRPDPLTLFDGWRNPRTRGPLLMLGVFVLLGMLTIMSVFSAWLGASATPEELTRLTESPEALAAFVAERNLWTLIIPAGLIAAVILAGLYFGVPLVKFAGARPLAAVTTSLRACLRNWAALLVFGLIAAGVGLAGGLIAVMVALPLVLAFGDGAGGVLAQIPILIIALIIQLVLAGGQYRAFVEIFGGPGDEGAPEDNALVA